MIPMKKKEYTRPEAQVFEVNGCGMICASIPISDKETNNAGRISRQGRDDWENIWDNAE